MLLVDTGVLVAATDRPDRHHQACARLIEDDPGPLVTTTLVIAECVYLIERELGSQPSCSSIKRSSTRRFTSNRSRPRTGNVFTDLVDQYADLPLGGTDASLIAIAERLNLARIATLDHRHFGVVRPAASDAFEIVP